MLVREFYASRFWMQHEMFRYGSDNSTIIGGCLKGAIYYCRNFDLPATNLDMKRICDKLGVTSVVDWQDSPGRTLEEILKVCDELGI